MSDIIERAAKVIGSQILTGRRQLTAEQSQDVAQALVDAGLLREPPPPANRSPKVYSSGTRPTIPTSSSKGDEEIHPPKMAHTCQSLTQCSPY